MLARILLALSLLSTASACEPTEGEGYCTLIGWQEGLTLGITGGGDPYPPGRYRLEIEADDVELAVGITVGEGNTCPVNEPEDCQAQVDAGDRSFHASVVMYDDSEFELNLYYVALAEENGYGGGPETARLRVLRDGREIGRASIRPRYVRDEPNGPGCGTRTVASARLVILP